MKMGYREIHHEEVRGFAHEAFRQQLLNEYQCEYILLEPEQLDSLETILNEVKTASLHRYRYQLGINYRNGEILSLALAFIPPEEWCCDEISEQFNGEVIPNLKAGLGNKNFNR